jgi:two-component system, NarL family, sensor histidine kinase YdfH
VTLSVENGCIVMHVHDDGRGFDPAYVTPGHMSLSNMIRRAEALAGSFRVESTSGYGTTITVTVPVA